MNKHLAIALAGTLILLCNTFTLHAQFHNFRKVEEVKDLQKKTLLVAISNDAEINAALEKALVNRWTFSPFKVIDESSVAKYKTSKEHSCLRNISKIYGYGPSVSLYAVLNSCKLPKEIVTDVALSSLGDEGIRKENKLADIIMQVMMMNSIANYSVKLTDNDDLGYQKQVKSCAAASIDDLAEKTLLVREANLKTSLEEVKTVYSGKIQMATDKEVANAILEAQEDKAILLFESDDNSNKNYYVIINPATGHIYYYYRIQKLHPEGKMDLKEFSLILKEKKK